MSAKQAINDKLLTNPLTILFQSIMACESVPDDWKEESRNVATNYRPISLTSQLCKVLRRLLGIKLLSFWRLMHLLETPSMGLEKVHHV